MSKVTRLVVVFGLFSGVFPFLNNIFHPVHPVYSIRVPFNNLIIEFVIGQPQVHDTASSTCKLRGGRLVTIPDQQTQQFLVQTLDRIHYLGNDLWIGLSDSAVEGDWRWEDGNPLQYYGNWAPGESDNTLQHTVEDCASLEYKDQGRWHDKTCFFLKYDYICQYDIKASTPPQTIPTTQTTTKFQTTEQFMISCPDVDCDTLCKNGYYAIYVSENGCLACICKINK